MHWIEKYRAQVKQNRIIGAMLLIVSVFLFVYCIWFEKIWLIVIVFVSMFIGIISMCSKLSYRKYKEYYICFYVGLIKNYLIIEDEIQFEGGPFQHNYYGQLPDGTEVAAHLGSFGNVKFAIGSFNNQNISFF